MLIVLREVRGFDRERVGDGRWFYPGCQVLIASHKEGKPVRSSLVESIPQVAIHSWKQGREKVFMIPECFE